VDTKAAEERAEERAEEKSKLDSALRDIDIVEGDQGEGWVDPISARESQDDRLQREAWKIDEKLRRAQSKQAINRIL